MCRWRRSRAPTARRHPPPLLRRRLSPRRYSTEHVQRSTVLTIFLFQRIIMPIEYRRTNLTTLSSVDNRGGLVELSDWPQAAKYRPLLGVVRPWEIRPCRPRQREEQEGHTKGSWAASYCQLYFPHLDVFNFDDVFLFLCFSTELRKGVPWNVSPGVGSADAVASPTGARGYRRALCPLCRLLQIAHAGHAARSSPPPLVSTKYTFFSKKMIFAGVREGCLILILIFP